jgi:hypothetical protein
MPHNSSLQGKLMPSIIIYFGDLELVELKFILNFLLESTPQSNQYILAWNLLSTCPCYLILSHNTSKLAKLELFCT